MNSILDQMLLQIHENIQLVTIEVVVQFSSTSLPKGKLLENTTLGTGVSFAG